MFRTLVPSDTPISIHGMLHGSFGPQRTLFRVGLLHCLVQTPLPLNDQSQPLETDFAVGEALDIRVRLNPVAASTPEAHGKRGKRRVVPNSQRVDWAVALLGRNGLSANLKMRPGNSFTIPGKEGGAKAIWTDFEGRAVVTDPEALAHALQFGIGRQRAYGCGLLEVERVRQVL